MSGRDRALKDVNSRVSSLETWKEDVNRRLEELKSDIAKLSDRIDKVQSNELAHLNERIKEVENRKRDPITWSDLAKIIITVITTAGLVLATYIQYFVR